MGFVETSGGRAFVRDWNEGAPRRAIAVHCSLAHAGAWDGLAKGLPDDVHLRAMDMPGHGQSADWDKTRDLQDQTFAMLLDLISEGPVDLIGHSFGGTVCLRMALERPELVRSLTLVEPVLFALARERAEAIYDDHLRAFTPFIEKLQTGDEPEAARIFTDIWGTGERWEDLSARNRDYIATRIGLIVAGDSATFGDRASLLVPGRLEGLRQPVLLVEGGRSHRVIDAIQSELARRIGNTRRLVVPGAGHLVAITHPAPVADAISDLWQMVPA